MNIDSIIFDLDGTLWDSREEVAFSWNKALEEFEEVKDRLTKEDLSRTMGMQIKEIGRKLFPYLNDDIVDKVMEKCCDIECEYVAQNGAKLFNKLEDVLKTLSQKYKLFIVSNCQCGYIEAFYKAHKLEKYFIDFENPGRTGLSKGENIKLVIERNNLENPIYVGDTLGDQKAAKSAGVPFVYARYGFGEVEEYDYVIDSLEEILDIV